MPKLSNRNWIIIVISIGLILVALIWVGYSVYQKRDEKSSSSNSSSLSNSMSSSSNNSRDVKSNPDEPDNNRPIVLPKPSPLTN